ncbi:hypothetical protein LMS44_18240 [Halomonas profundus]|nr:hypothetical protein LMS44_18240 [Halomonas profundus]
MRTYSDAHIEHYADRFIALRMARHGVNLAQYLINPHQFERLALEPEPLLPAQEAAVLRIWQRWDTGLAPVAEGTTDSCENQAAGWDWRDLLDQWRDEVAQSEREVCQLSQRNGAAFEPMRHHRHNRGMNRGTSNFVRKQARKGA